MGIDFKKAQGILDQRKKDREDRGETGGSAGSKVKWYNLPATGELRVRFLPPVGDNPVPGKIVHKHYNMPSHKGLGDNSNITCFKTYDMECPICEVLDEYRDRLGPQQMKEFSASLAFFNVLILGQKDADPETVHVLKTSEYNYEWMLQQLVNVEVGDITDPEDGANVTFKRKKDKGPFDRIISRKPSPISATPEGIQTILDSMYDLDAIWKDPDDSYVNIAREIAKGLRTIIEDRLIKMGNANEGDLKQPVKEVQSAKRTRATATAAPEPEPETDGGEPEPVGEEPETEETTTTSSATHRRARATAASAPEPAAPAAPATRGRAKTQAAPAAAPDAKTTTATNATSAPKGAPECFGKQHDESSKKCISCPFEFDCNLSS